MGSHGAVAPKAPREAWRLASGDPDTEVESWLRFGGPTGIEYMPNNVGVFASVDSEDIEDPTLLLVSEDSKGATKVDNGAEALRKLEDLANKRDLEKFDTFKEVQVRNSSLSFVFALA